MKVINRVNLKPGSREELLPDFSPEFPYIASYVEMDRFLYRQSPWHWHNAVELFYMEQGTLEYLTPHEKLLFPAGSAGFVNSNVLHMSKTADGARTTASLIHLFDPVLIGGWNGSLIDRKYILPLTAASRMEITAFYPDNTEHARMLDLIRQSFRLSEEDNSYEIRLRSVLSQIWCLLLETAKPLRGKTGDDDRVSGKIKTMVVYVHEHFAEKITVAQIAATAFISERECFRIFHDCLHTTPVEYMIGYRIQKACHMLTDTDESITRICQSCGLGSSSYFGKLFRERIGCSPLQYRKEYRNSAPQTDASSGAS